MRISYWSSDVCSSDLATFAALDTDGTSAVDAAADAEQARSELEVLAEDYILKRTQAVTLKWAIEKYRERHQDPLLLRAGELFSTLTTIGRAPCRESVCPYV